MDLIREGRELLEEPRFRGRCLHVFDCYFESFLSEPLLQRTNGNIERAHDSLAGLGKDVVFDASHISSVLSGNNSEPRLESWGSSVPASLRSTL